MKAKAKNRKSQPKSSTLPWMLGLFGLLAVIIAVVIVTNGGANGSSANAAAALMGEAAAFSSSNHVATGTDPGPYSTNPPAGGPHYAEDYDAGFYTESDPETQVEYPEGYLVHSMEHGYIIFWYNCAANPALDCADLQQQIRDVMDQAGNLKTIAFPWPSMDVPLALTSWGRILKLDAPDTQVMAQFVRTNRNKAPEPNMP